MAETALSVIICGRVAGTLRQDSRGLMSFSYSGDYSGAPLSLSMPVSNRVFGQSTVRPYLFGLLPDSEQQRRAIANEHGISANNPVAMLERIGLDCPGAVQFCPCGQEASATTRNEEFVPLADREIAQRLRSIRSDRDATWMGREESWSLGGNQGKFALALRDGSWCECRGAAPTTHIFKNGVAGFKLEALNEYVCMRTAKACGIEAADVEYRLFEDEPALIVSRYDRIGMPDGGIDRLHQEDLCQSLDVMPDQKYTSDGGPAAHDVIGLLARTGQARANLALFTRMLFFNCLIGAPDAHAKNYSLLLGLDGNALLAPLYDVASGLAYENARRRGRLAMSVGGENRFGRVGRGAIERYAGRNDVKVARAMDGAGLDADACAAIMAELAQAIPDAMTGVFDEAIDGGIPGTDELRERLLGPVKENCAATLALLG